MQERKEKLGLSLVVEIFPESLLLWAIYPELRSPGDFISTLAGGLNIDNRAQNRPNLSNKGKINTKRVIDNDKKRQKVKNRTLSRVVSEKHKDIARMSPKSLSKKYDVSERTAYRWKESLNDKYGK